MLPFLNDSQFANIDSESNPTNSFDQSITFGKNHPNDDDSIDVFDHEFPGASIDLLVSHEDFTLDPEYDSVKEDVVIKNSSSFHYPLCSTICDVSTYDGDNPCSLSSSSNELYYEFTQGDEIIPDVNENN